MAISNFLVVTETNWNPAGHLFYPIPASPTRSGEMNSNLTITWFRSSDVQTPNAFAIAISSSGPETVTLAMDGTTADNLIVTCVSSEGGQGIVYYTFTESQGWTLSFNVTVTINNRNNTRGTVVFTKGKLAEQ